MRGRITSSWPMWSALAAQAVLTAGWLWRTAPFTDEALYLQAGHAEWAHWLRQAPLPDYASWFSGAPALYPPLAAAADSAGGLVAARALSLAFMLATTALVYLAGRRLFGWLAGSLATLVFAVSGLVVHYGAFATFGPPALFLLVLSAWAAIQIRDGGFGWMPACAAALAAANAVKYATLAWDPVIVGIIILHGWQKGRRRAAGRAASLATTVIVLVLGLVMLGGSGYARGVIVTTVSRSIRWGAPAPAASVLAHALAVTGALLLPAVLGVAVSVLTRQPPTTIMLSCLLVAAALIAPTEQARIHELPSLDKNMAFGVPFAALGAGYALGAGRAWLARAWPWGRIAATAAVCVAILAVGVSGRYEKIQFRGPGIAVADQIVTAIRRSYRPGTLVLSDSAARMEQYYLPVIPPTAWERTYTHSAGQRLLLADQIRSCMISVVVFRMGGASQPHDPTVMRWLRHAGRYRLATVATSGAYRTAVWTLQPGPRRRGRCR